MFGWFKKPLVNYNFSDYRQNIQDLLYPAVRIEDGKYILEKNFETILNELTDIYIANSNKAERFAKLKEHMEKYRIGRRQEFEEWQKANGFDYESLVAKFKEFKSG